MFYTFDVASKHWFCSVKAFVIIIIIIVITYVLAYCKASLVFLLLSLNIFHTFFSFSVVDFEQVYISRVLPQFFIFIFYLTSYLLTEKLLLTPTLCVWKRLIKDVKLHSLLEHPITSQKITLTVFRLFFSKKTFKRNIKHPYFNFFYLDFPV